MSLANYTIVALSSGALPSGVAVVRLSGAMCRHIVERLTGDTPEPRVMSRRWLKAVDGVLIDDGLVVWFPGPKSFTGEDCAEFQVHGSRAVVARLLDEILQVQGVRLADAGEFTRRAFENGKMDLTAVEGLGDLIAAETEAQRALAIDRASGSLAKVVGDWRGLMARLRAQIEANLDFSDEDDVPEDLGPDFHSDLDGLIRSIEEQLDLSKGAELVRDGFRVVLAGAPNAGKSSLLNALAGRDVAIVTSEAGTTRDVREVLWDLNGSFVRLYDVAGLRETDSLAEAEGVRRAIEVIETADLVVWLDAADAPLDRSKVRADDLVVGSKSDVQPFSKRANIDLAVSAGSGIGLTELTEMIGDRVHNAVPREAGVVSRERDRVALRNSLGYLAEAERPVSLELRAEALRSASAELGRLIGVLDPEDVLDSLFSGFCVGK